MIENDETGQALLSICNDTCRLDQNQLSRNRRNQTPKNEVYNQKKSPFLVDLVAENERIDEENKVRLKQQLRRQKAVERKREEAKNNIILRALREANELDALRRERRNILEEERRLKALSDIEKTNAHRKEDRIAAIRAERRRKMKKTACRRAQNKSIIEEEQEAQKEILRLKHNISVPPDNTFSSFSSNS